MGDLALCTSFDDDVAEFLLVDEAASGIHAELVRNGSVVWWSADHAGGNLYVLLSNRLHHVTRR